VGVVAAVVPIRGWGVADWRRRKESRIRDGRIGGNFRRGKRKPKLDLLGWEVAAVDFEGFFGPRAMLKAKGRRSFNALQKSLTSDTASCGAWYPFVISTMKKMVPNVARAVSAVIFLQNVRGKSCNANGQQVINEFPGFSAQRIYSINASVELGRS
jgi:hypothetical protein